MGATSYATTYMLLTIDAGTNLLARRPFNYSGAVFWRFDAGVDPGANGENVRNAKPGDLFFVAGS